MVNRPGRWPSAASAVQGEPAGPVLITCAGGSGEQDRVREGPGVRRMRPRRSGGDLVALQLGLDPGPPPRGARPGPRPARRPAELDGDPGRRRPDGPGRREPRPRPCPPPALGERRPRPFLISSRRSRPSAASAGELGLLAGVGDLGQLVGGVRGDRAGLHLGLDRLGQVEQRQGPGDRGVADLEPVGELAVGQAPGRRAGPDRPGPARPAGGPRGGRSPRAGPPGCPRRSASPVATTQAIDSSPASRGGPEPALADDDHVAVRRVVPADPDRLELAPGLEAGREPLQGLGVELGPGLVGVRR